MEPPQTGKRIVSKGEYVRKKVQRAGIIVAGVTTFFGAVTIILLAFARMPQYGVALVCLVTFLGLMANVDTWWHDLKTKAQSIDPGVPLTRANTAELPAPESLVRASTEPVQEQEAMLLRAATETQETPPEQLVRAVGRAE